MSERSRRNIIRWYITFKNNPGAIGEWQLRSCHHRPCLLTVSTLKSAVLYGCAFQKAQPL